MKYTFLLFFITSLTFAQQKPLVLDKIVAQIGDNIILKSDIESQKHQEIDSNQNKNANQDCAILEKLLMQNLFLNQAELDSIKISDTQVDGEMENRLRVIEQQIGGRQKNGRIL